jgi:Rod binding domain-containing protein
MDGLQTPLLTSPLAASLAADKARNDPAKIAKAAKQFEGLLIEQILKIARESTQDGWLGTDDDDAASSAMDLGQDYFARSIAQNGGFGLARMIVAGLEQTQAKESSPTSDATPKDPASRTAKLPGR